MERDYERFDVNLEPASVGSRWKRWLRGFELYVQSRDIISADRKKAMLLHCAGLGVQDIFETLTIDQGVQDVYVEARRALNEYFLPRIKYTYERHVFRSITQEENETYDQFLLRLKQQAVNCNFGNGENDQIIDQIIEKCKSGKLRRMLLEQETDPNLEKCGSIARCLEASERQANAMEMKVTEVNRLNVKIKKDKEAKEKDKANGKCYRCGNTGHFAKDQVCPAWGERCNKCNGKNHFSSVCKSKVSVEKKGKRLQVRNVEEMEGSDDEKEFNIFSVRPGDCTVTNKLPVTIGGIDMVVLIDSGAECNIMGKKYWEYLKENGVKCKTLKISKALYPYGQNEPLEIVQKFEAAVKTSKGILLEDVEFFVFNGEGIPLLGRKTSENLKVLKIGLNVHAVDQIPDESFKQVFEGQGKLKNFQLTIPIKENSKPVCQPARRIPYGLRKAVENKIKYLLENDIIEEVEGPTLWCSPLVIVPKKNGDIRLCVDMRRANTAVLREKFQLPTIEEVLYELNGSSIFSRLDIKDAYHQIELDENSRSITTFSTHKGIYRYKRLMFGISCAPEMYHRVLSQILQGLEGCCHFMDDIIVYGGTKAQHDERLRKVLSIMLEKNIRLNKEKCQFALKEMVFLGHKFSKYGIQPTDSSKENIKEFRTPRNAEEVRSFLGLVNFSAKFIQDYSTISEPLRKMLKKDTEFKWGKEEAVAFEKLKAKLCETDVLGFYDPNAKTIVVTDASPVGLGAVLIQKQGNEQKVIRYASRSLNDTEKKYSQTEKEALAIVWACEKLSQYLVGKQFELITDHKPLEVLFGKKSKPCARIERWVLRLQSFTFTIKYTQGKSNIADPLSRLLDTGKIIEDEQEDDLYVRFVLRNAVPKAVTISEIQEESRKDEVIQEIMKSIQTGKWSKELRKYELMKEELCVERGILLRGTRIIMPSGLWERILQIGHEGHLGIVAMKQLLRTKVWWQTMYKDVEKWVKSCHGCQLTSRPDPPEPLRPTKIPENCWEMISMDFQGPLPSNDYLLIIVDYYSRYYEVEIMRSCTSENLINKVKPIFARYGNPETVVTDNGTAFTSKEFEEFLEERDIYHHCTTPLHPQANGEVERQNSSILKRLRIAQAEKENWKEELLKYLQSYRATPHTTTGIAPSVLMFGREIRTKLPIMGKTENTKIKEEIGDADMWKKDKYKIYTDKKRRAKESGIAEGDLVLMKQVKENKLTTPFNNTPMEVLKKDGNSVLVKSPSGKEVKRNSTHFKVYHKREENINEEGLHHQDSDREVDDKVDVKTPDVKIKTNSDSGNEPREKRQIKLPTYLKDYIRD